MDKYILRKGQKGIYLLIWGNMFERWIEKFQKERSTRWYSWKCEPPKPGEYIYCRDLDASNIVEIAWCVGKVDGTINCVVVNDPTASQIQFDEWQLVPPPTD